MSLGIHALDNIDVLLSRVDLAFVDVVARDEEGSLGIILIHQVQDMTGEHLLRTIIVGERDSAGLDTVIDTSAAICN